MRCTGRKPKQPRTREGSLIVEEGSDARTDTRARERRMDRRTDHTATTATLHRSVCEVEFKARSSQERKSSQVRKGRRDEGTEARSKQTSKRRSEQAHEHKQGRRSSAASGRKFNGFPSIHSRTHQSAKPPPPPPPHTHTHTHNPTYIHTHHNWSLAEGLKKGRMGKD